VRFSRSAVKIESQVVVTAPFNDDATRLALDPPRPDLCFSASEFSFVPRVSVLAFRLAVVFRAFQGRRNLQMERVVQPAPTWCSFSRICRAVWYTFFNRGAGKGKSFWA